MSALHGWIARLILTRDEHALLLSLRKLDKGEQQFFLRAITALAQQPTHRTL